MKDDNIIREIDKNGKENIRFRTVQAWETADAIDRLCAAYKEAKLHKDTSYKGLWTVRFTLNEF